MYKVWKFAVPIEPRVSITMPRGARILTMQAGSGPLASGALNLWALVDPEAPREAREFEVVGTGEPVDDRGHYLGTAQFHSGALVFHVFELKEES